ncbi:MAG: hypothetical protein ACHQ3P_08445 [Candidatus Limnocylindrales bacterium]
MRPPRLIVAAIVALVGLAWIGQGSGAIGGSAMSGNSFWEYVGVALIAVAAVLFVVEVRHARTVRP